MVTGRYTMFARKILLIGLAGRVAVAAAGFPATFASEVIPPDENTVTPLLRAVCADGIRRQVEDGRQVFGCGDVLNEIVPLSAAPRRYPWSSGVQWRVDGIIFGHFLSATSDDVAVSGAGAESHPYLWGGTLLLTKKNGEWEPVWYRMGVITRHCRHLPLSTGRQILFCEETDSGMGHGLHFLYSNDFLNARRAWDSAVFVADSYDSLLNGGVQKQNIDRVEFVQASPKETTVRIFARHGGVKLSPEDQDRLDREGWPTPQVRRYRVDLRLTGDHFIPTRETATAAKLFSIQ